MRSLLTRKTRKGTGTDQVNFMICGSRRSGTTSLEYYLHEHPRVEFITVPDFESIGGLAEGMPFNGPFTAIRRGAAAAAQYESVVGEHAGRYQCLGWRAVYCMWFPHMIFNMAEQMPGVKLLFSLRNPLDTAYSVFARRWARGETRTFEDLVGYRPDVDPTTLRPSSVCQFLQRGFYEPSLQLFFRLFSRDRIHVYPFDEMVARPQETMKGVFRFLELDEDFNSERAGEVRSRSEKPEPMKPETRAWLHALYSPYNRRLFDLLGWPRDLWDR